jgi:hypothetical protein
LRWLAVRLLSWVLGAQLSHAVPPQLWLLERADSGCWLPELPAHFLMLHLPPDMVWRCYGGCMYCHRLRRRLQSGGRARVTRLLVTRLRMRPHAVGREPPQAQPPAHLRGVQKDGGQQEGCIHQQRALPWRHRGDELGLAPGVRRHARAVLWRVDQMQNRRFLATGRGRDAVSFGGAPLSQAAGLRSGARRRVSKEPAAVGEG